jgi:ASC-1-like (ASCH) protein
VKLIGFADKMSRKINEHMPSKRRLSDVIISEYAALHGEFTRTDILNTFPSLKLTSRQASYALSRLAKERILTLSGQGRAARYIITNRPIGITYEMNLNPRPFEAIKERRKTVEMRLNDERRRYIRPGDFILFTNTEIKEELLVRVVERREFESFNALYDSYPKRAIGYADDEDAKPSDMLQYYTVEQIKEHGALALGVSLDM